MHSGFVGFLGLPFFAGLRLVASDSERAFRVDYDSRLFPEFDEANYGGKAEIALIQREDGGCSHLVGIGGYERCGVYAARPSTCRLYPVVWESDVAQGGPPVISCPVAYGMTPAMEDDFYRDAKESIENWQLHDELLREWEAESERDVESSTDASVEASTSRSDSASHSRNNSSCSCQFSIDSFASRRKRVD